MKELSLRVQESELKTVYVFSPEAFDDLYDKVMDNAVETSEILAEFEKRKIIEAF